MRARNAWIFAGIAVAVPAAAVLIARARPADRPGSGSGDDARNGYRVPVPGNGYRVPVPATRRPDRSIPPPSSRQPRPGPEIGDRSDDFDAEGRDEAWAAGAEDEVRRRLGHLGLTSVDIECRRRQCRVVLTAGDEAALSDAVSGLGEPDALYGYADQIVLTGEGVTAEGEAFVVLYAQFDRE